MTKEKILENYHATPCGCRIWNSGIRGDGYGQVWYEGKDQYAHRVVYALTKGEIPVGMFVCHHCDTRLCINPDHLFLGTQKDNMQDAAAKGRMEGPRGEKNVAAKLTEKDVKDIRGLLVQDVLQKDIAILYGVSRMTISYIKTGRCWGWLDEEPTNGPVLRA